VDVTDSVSCTISGSVIVMLDIEVLLPEPHVSLVSNFDRERKL